MHGHPSFRSPTVDSQIDYIIMRCADSNHRSKLAKPLHDFPVGAHRLTNHYPVQAAIPMLPMGFRQRHMQASPKYQASALQLAVARGAPEAQSLCQAVQRRLEALSQAETLSIEHDRVNGICWRKPVNTFHAANRRIYE